MKTDLTIMRKIYTFALAVILTGHAQFISGQEQNATKSTIYYTRLTSGLHEPTFEGGRTDFAMIDINDDGHVDLLSIGDHGNPLSSTLRGRVFWFGLTTGREISCCTCRKISVTAVLQLAMQTMMALKISGMECTTIIPKLISGTN